MTLVPPSDVVEAIADKIALNHVLLGIKDSGAISQDTKSGELSPPYCVVFADFDQDAQSETGDSVLLGVPVEIKVLCSSGQNTKAALSFAEAFAIVNKAITLVKGTLPVTIGVETTEVQILLRKKPFDILSNKANQVLLQINFYYELDAVGE